PATGRRSAGRDAAPTATPTDVPSLADLLTCNAKPPLTLGSANQPAALFACPTGLAEERFGFAADVRGRSADRRSSHRFCPPRTPYSPATAFPRGAASDSSEKGYTERAHL